LRFNSSRITSSEASLPTLAKYHFIQTSVPKMFFFGKTYGILGLIWSDIQQNKPVEELKVAQQ